MQEEAYKGLVHGEDGVDFVSRFRHWLSIHGGNCFDRKLCSGTLCMMSIWRVSMIDEAATIRHLIVSQSLFT